MSALLAAADPLLPVAKALTGSAARHDDPAGLVLAIAVAVGLALVGPVLFVNRLPKED